MTRALLRQRCRLAISGCAWTILVVSAPVAQAEESAARVLEEIVVTAQKREESLQKTPIAVTAFTADSIERLEARTLAGLAQYVPNLQFSTGAAGTGGAANFFIRGIGQIDFITTTEPGVGTYLDGVYLARVTGASLELADIERVEVLRGPQGTLFGRNTIGGAISVITKRPAAQFGGSAEVRVGNRGRLDGRATLDVPIVAGLLSSKLSVLSKNSDGWGKNAWPQASGGRDLGADSDLAGRLQVAWTPSDSTEVLFAGDYTRRRGTSLPHAMVNFVPSASTDSFNQSANPPIGPQWIARDPDDVQVDTSMRDASNVRGASVTVDWTGEMVKFRSITAWRDQDGLSGQDYDGSPTPYLNQTVDLDQSQRSQEFQLTGTAFGQRLKWLGGLYAFNEEGAFDSLIVLSGTPITIFPRNETESVAAFGQATYAITGRADLTLGARWTREKKQLDVTTVFGPFVLVPPTHVADTFSAVSPKIGLDVKLTEQALIYVSVSRGFRSGGFNGRPFAPADLTSFDEEICTSYEVGAKTEWLGRTLRVNAAVFHNDYDDIQLTATSTNAQGQFVIITGNAAKAALTGAELEIEAAPLDGLTLLASAGYLENDLQEKPGFSFGATELPSAPEWTLAGAVGYRRALSSGWVMDLGADASYRSGSFPQFNPASASYIHAYGLLNARIGAETPSGNLRVSLYGTNLADRTYRTFGQTAGTNDVSIGWLGRTREYGVRIVAKF